MIISKVRLRRDVGSSGALARMLMQGAMNDRGHGLLWSLFGETGKEPRTYLYRQIEQGHFIVVSRPQPKDEHNLWRIDSKPYEPDLQSGQRLHFVLRANPVVSVRAPGACRGKRADAIMHAQYKLSPGERNSFEGMHDVALDWLLKREAVLGAAFARERCSATGYQQVVIRKEGKRDPITFSEIDYEGELTVSDPGKFMLALMNGVGKARGYGCGLILVKPVR